MSRIARSVTYQSGFTLLQLAIVLVVVSLIIGAIFVAQDLIQTSTIRSQIAQLQLFQSAINTFENKYNCLPGDCRKAADYGFPARGIYAGEGDGNGVIEGINCNSPSCDLGTTQLGGETIMAWVDLSMAGLIPGKFNSASSTATVGSVSGNALKNYFPEAKVGNASYIYFWSGGFDVPMWGGSIGNGINYLGISAITNMIFAFNGVMVSNPGVTVKQSFAIDTKLDDGLPITGDITAMYVNGVAWPYAVWSTHAASPTTGTCYDTAGPGGSAEYSTSKSDGNGVNCGLSVQFR